MMERFPNRTFDVGIAEQHAVTLSAGMATQGMVPFCTIYSTFLQRAYDQVIHDVALQNLPVIFCLDRAGLVGEDGATHHGIFDLTYLRAIPNMIVVAPRNELELRNIMYTAHLGLDHPIAIRYPRGRGITVDWKQPFSAIKIGTGICLKDGEGLAILSVGTIANHVIKALEEFPDIAHFDMRFVKPLDEPLLHAICKKYATIVTVEEGVKKGGFGTAVLEFTAHHQYSVSIKVLGIEDVFTEHGTVEELHKTNGIDAVSIAKNIRSVL